jgi:hypothetical protein
MKIRDKKYPIPVLSSFSDDYLHTISRLTVDIKSKLIAPQAPNQSAEVQISFDASCGSSDLMNLIQNKQALFTYHIECPKTSYREIFQSNKTNETISIDSRKLNGKIEICTFIVAKTDISGMPVNDLNPDYHHIKIDIDKGCILAVGNSKVFEAKKTDRDYKNIHKIFTLNRGDKSLKHFKFEFGIAEQISITLPHDEYDSVVAIDKNKKLKPVLHTALIVPILNSILDKLVAMSENDRNLYEGKYWYTFLEEKINEILGYGFDDPKFHSKNLDNLEMAQKIVRFPLNDALNHFMKGFK